MLCLLEKNTKKDKLAWKSKFQCFCGKVFETRLYNVISGRSKSCGCGIRIANAKRAYADLTLSSFNELFQIYRRNALKVGKIFFLSKENFRYLIEKDCYYCASKDRAEYKHKTGKLAYKYTGIDRLDNSRGYSLNNCVPCCKICNFMKTTLSKNAFILQIIKIHANLRNI